MHYTKVLELYDNRIGIDINSILTAQYFVKRTRYKTNDKQTEQYEGLKVELYYLRSPWMGSIHRNNLTLIEPQAVLLQAIRKSVLPLLIQ